MYRDFKKSRVQIVYLLYYLFTQISITYNLTAGRKTVTNDYGVFLGILDPDDVFSYEE